MFLGMIGLLTNETITGQLLSWGGFFWVGGHLYLEELVLDADADNNDLDAG